jgi:hypothetical protein
MLVAAIRLALWTLPFATTRRLLTNRVLGSLLPAALVDLPIERLAWAVQTTSRRIPLATCLTQSLALQCLLTRAGRPSALRIGVLRSEASGFQAHAWVDCDGRTLIDRPEDVATYTRLVSWDSPESS